MLARPRRPFLLPALLFACALAVAGPAGAQESGTGGAQAAAEGGSAASEAAGGGDASAPESERERQERERATLQELLAETEQAQKELDSGLISDARLTHWRTRLPEVRSRAAAIEAVARQDLQSARRLLEALGPPPEDGREPRPVAMERDRLSTRVSEHEARMKQAQLVAAQAEELLSAVQDTARTRFTNRLLVQGPSAVHPSTWLDAGKQFAGAWTRLFSAIASTNTGVRDPGDWLRVGGGAVALTLAGLIVALLIRRALLRRFPREDQAEPPATLTRLSGALLHTLFYLLVPGLIMGALYAYLEAVGVMVGVIDQLARHAIVAIGFGFVVDGLAGSVLAARAPSWRVLPVNDACAHRMKRLATLGAVVFAADILIVRMGTELQAGRAIAVVHHLIFGALVSALLLWLIRREVWHPPELDESDEAEQAPRRKARNWAIVGAFAFTLAVVGSAAFGYYELSRFILGRTITSAILVGLLLLLHAVAHEGIAAAFRATRLRGRGGEDQSSSILQFWMGAALDLLLFVLGALLMLPLWGVEWVNLWSLLRGAMLGFQIGEITIAPLEIALAIVAFVAILSITRMIQRALDSRVFPQTKLDVGVRDSMRTFTGYTGLVLAGLVALSTAGLNLSNLAIVAGALSVGIGFGLQAIVNNFVSGLILLFERPMKVGDWVVIGAHQGFIKRIRVRSTEIETFDQSSVIVPNSDFISQPIINWTHTNRVCRVIVPVHVAHGTDTQQVHDILLAVARDHQQVLRMPEPHVLFMSFGESALHFELRVFSRDTDYFLSLASELRFAIDQRFREAGVVIPFPQRDLHIRSGSWQQGEARVEPATDIPEQGTTPPSGGPDGD